MPYSLIRVISHASVTLYTTHTHHDDFLNQHFDNFAVDSEKLTARFWEVSGKIEASKFGNFKYENKSTDL